MAAILLSVGPAVRLSALQCPDGSPPPCRAQPARASAPAPNSVAVLYFDNLSPDTADAYLADGLTEALIVRLGQIERLVVKSRNAVRLLRGGTAGEPGAVGRSLGAAHLVSGSVRRAGSRLRVAVELVRTATGLRLWGELYERADADLFAVEEDIARAVATAVAGRLLPSERATLAARPTASPQAYDLFVRGNYSLARRNPLAALYAIRDYEAALRLDPAFGQALARIAYAYALFLAWGWDHPGVPAESLLTRGLALVDRALGIDATLSDAWMARGFLLSERDPRTFHGVIPSFERALSLDPRNAEAHHQVGFIWWVLGEDSAATAAYRLALALEPERATTLEHLARLFYAGRRYAEARRWADSALALDSTMAFAYLFRARMRLRLNDPAGALRDAQTAIQLGVAEGGEAVLAQVELGAGDTVSARARLDRVLSRLPVSGPLKLQEALYPAADLVALGQIDGALNLLERVQPGGVFWSHLRKAEFDALRSHPRFQRVVEQSRPPEPR